MLTKFRSAYASARALKDCYTKPRTTTMRALGAMLHPQSIADAWYAADCPPSLGWSGARRAGVSLKDRLRWKVGCALRGATAGQ